MQRRLATLGLFYCAAIWGSTFFIVKDTVATLDPLLLVGYRFILGGLLLAPLALWRARALSRPRGSLLPGRIQASVAKSGMAGCVLGAILFVLYAAQTAGLVYTTATNSGFITGLFIVFVPFISWLMSGRRPAALQLIAVGVAAAGLALLTGGMAELNAGDALTIACAGTYAWHVLLADQYARAGLDAYIMCFAQTMVTGLLGLAAALVLGAHIDALSGRTLAAVLFLTLFPTMSAFLIQLWAQRHVPPFRVALIFTLEPVFAALFAWTLGHEVFVPGRAVGGLVILGAMVLAESGALKLQDPTAP